jgi:hypothetical protein
MLPADIFILNALPLTKAEYEDPSSVNDFIPHFKKEKLKDGETADWPSYEREIVNPYKKFKQFISSYGVHFFENVTLNDFSKVVLQKHELIILMSHCKNGGTEEEAIEFNNGLKGSCDVLDIIPLKYDKILDLGICNPSYFSSLVQARRPAMVLRYAAVEISIIYWSIFYSELLIEIVENKRDYFDAYKEALYNMLDFKKKDNATQGNPKRL